MRTCSNEAAVLDRVSAAARLAPGLIPWPHRLVTLAGHGRTIPNAHWEMMSALRMLAEFGDVRPRRAHCVGEPVRPDLADGAGAYR